MRTIENLIKPSLQVALERFERTQRALNGKCSYDLTSCPRFIEPIINLDITTLDTEYSQASFCKICIEEFSWLRQKDPIKSGRKCPCERCANEEEVFLRLNELIEEIDTLL